MFFLILISTIFILLVLYTVKNPGVAIVSVWCMYAIEQWAQGSNVFFIRHNSLINIVIGSIVLAGVVIKFFKHHQLFKDYPKVALPILLLFAYSYISIYWTVRIDLSNEIWGKYWPYLVTFLLLSPLLFTKQDEFNLVFKVFVIVGGVVVYALLFHVEWFHRRIIFAGSHFNNELLGNPLAVAQMAGYLFFVCMFMLRKNEEKISYWLVPIKFLVGVICLLLIVKSGSRGQLLALLATFIILFPLVYKISSFKGILLISIFSILIVSSILWGLDEFWSESSRWNQNEMEKSMGGRFENVFVLLEYWAKDPLSMLFGLGNSASYNPKVIGIYPHFVPFEILGEEGIIGFFIYGIILISIIRISISGINKTKENVVERQFFTILLAMVCYSFFLSLKQGSLLGNMEFFMAALILSKYDNILQGEGSV